MVILYTVCENSRFSMGLNYGHIFRRLWTKVHQIKSADVGEIAVCSAVFRLSICCSVPEIFAIEVRSRPKSRRKSMFSASKFFWGEDPKFWIQFLILHPFPIMWQSLPAIGRETDISTCQDVGMWQICVRWWCSSMVFVAGVRSRCPCSGVWL